MAQLIRSNVKPHKWLLQNSLKQRFLNTIITRAEEIETKRRLDTLHQEHKNARSHLQNLAPACLISGRHA